MWHRLCYSDVIFQDIYKNFPIKYVFEVTAGEKFKKRLKVQTRNTKASAQTDAHLQDKNLYL